MWRFIVKFFTCIWALSFFAGSILGFLALIGDSCNTVIVAYDSREVVARVTGTHIDEHSPWLEYEYLVADSIHSSSGRVSGATFERAKADGQVTIHCSTWMHGRSTIERPTTFDVVLALIFQPIFAVVLFVIGLIAGLAMLGSGKEIDERLRRDSTAAPTYRRDAL